VSVSRPRSTASLALLAFLLAWFAVTAGGAPRPSAAPPRAAPDTSVRTPTLLLPARPDSAPPETEPAPLLIPGRPSAGDSAIRSRAQQAREQFALGQQFEAAGRAGPAIVAYRNATSLDPEIPEANLRMARLFLTRDQVDEAAKCLAEEVRYHPNNTVAIRELGVALARLGDSERAIAHLERLVKRQPRDDETWHALGFAYLAGKRPKDAVIALQRAVALPPVRFEEHRDLGAAYMALGRDAEARAEYRRALRLVPRDPSTWLNLGNLERRAGRRDSALACYRRAEARDSSFTLALQGQVQLLREMGRDDLAVGAYRRWLHHRPDQHGARLEAVQLLTALHRDDEALAVAREGAEQAADSGQPHLILGMVLMGRGESRAALAELRRAEALFKKEPGEQERARRLIGALRASAPDSLRALFTADSVAAARRP
jgi:tetratricopeptide (TPR) repeat protein